MNLRIILVSLLTALLSLVPIIYLYMLWPTMPTLVAVHFDADGTANRFTDHHNLLGLAFWPFFIFIIFTFFPQVHSKQTLFWSSPRQRQARALIVAAMVVVITAFIHLSVGAGKTASILH